MQVVGAALPYDTLPELRERMAQVSPTLVRYNRAEASTLLPIVHTLLGHTSSLGVADDSPLKARLHNLKEYYITDAITRASPTMAHCVHAYNEQLAKDQSTPSAAVQTLAQWHCGTVSVTMGW